MPVVTKQDLQGRFNPKEMRSRLGLTGLAFTTGGATGEPTPFLLDDETTRAQRAASIHCHSQMGWCPGMPLVCVWGSNRDIGRQQSTWQGRLSAYVRNIHLVGGYRLTSDTTDAVPGLVRRFRSVAVYGSSSMLEFVARDALDTAA